MGFLVNFPTSSNLIYERFAPLNLEFEYITKSTPSSMEIVISLAIFFSIIWIFTLILSSKRAARKRSAKLPPGPYPYPIIGNILELGQQPHQSLAKLAKTYGPLMSLNLGSITTIVVSSPETAKSVLQTHDLVFSSRKVPSAAESLDHNKFSMVWLPVENQWRKLRKICKEQMFSVPRLDATYSLRKEKLEKLHCYVEKCSETGRSVDIGEAAFTTALNLMSATLFSKEFAEFGSDSAQEMKKLFWDVMKCVGRPNLSDFFPVLKPVDPQGILKETRICFGKLFEIFDGIIDEKLKNRAKGGENEKCHDLVEALLDVNQRDESELSRIDINNLLLDLFVAGADTTSGTVEWAMSELLRNPEKLSRVRSEIKNVVGENGEIQETDIPKLPYLQAVVKETFRLHPAGPLLVPHKANEDIEIHGYTIPRNAQVFVNAWAIGRDSNTWTDANLFMPERFLDHSEIDFRGKDFDLIPFGAGRRICPGLPLAYRMVHLMLATLVHKFSWKLEDGVNPHEIDMTEKFGLSLQKAIPLKAIPIQL